MRKFDYQEQRTWYFYICKLTLPFLSHDFYIHNKIIYSAIKKISFTVKLSYDPTTSPLPAWSILSFLQPRPKSSKHLPGTRKLYFCHPKNCKYYKEIQPDDDRLLPYAKPLSFPCTSRRELSCWLAPTKRIQSLFKSIQPALRSPWDFV